MSPIDFLKVDGEAQIKEVATLADQIWREHYTPIIGKAQVDYMLTNMQSPTAIHQQIQQDGYHYYLIQDSQGNLIGYLGFTVEEQTLFLSKIYLKLEYRGLGYAREAMRFLESFAKERGSQKIVLTVNKRNQNTIHAYEKMGFSKAKPIVQDIGNGFVMDDYKMEKSLKG